MLTLDAVCSGAVVPPFFEDHSSRSKLPSLLIKERHQSMSDKNGFLRNLFLGDVHEDKIFPYPRMREEEQEVVDMISDSLKKFGKDVDQDKIDKEEVPPM